jgi:gamma-glutamyltranspeptidase/glutathione hydrolase
MKPFNARRAPIYARHGIACSSQPLAAAVGRDILRAGGNAVDAAVAMAAMVNLTEPMMNGLGGDCFALVRFGGEIFALNGSGRSGSRCTVEAIRAQGHSRMPKAGAIWRSTSVSAPWTSPTSSPLPSTMRKKAVR